MQDLFARVRVEGGPALSDCMLVAFSRAEVRGDYWRADLFRALFNEASEYRIFPDLVEKDSNARVRAFQ